IVAAPEALGGGGWTPARSAMLSIGSDGMTASPRQSSAAKRASFIFTGTVQALKRATVPNVPLSERTVVVRVDEVVRGSGALSHLAGRDITVQLGDRERVRPGQAATF